MDYVQNSGAAVELADVTGGWFVRVTEKDGTVQIRSFEHKDFAVSFAEGQRMRLGLDKIIRV